MSQRSSRRPGVADVLTLGNALCGAAAIFVIGAVEPLSGLTSFQRYAVAAGLFLCGTLLDVLDGAAARRWGGTALGAPLDSLADGLTFGIAPVVVVGAYVTPGASQAERFMVAVGGLVYVAAALLRLADFMAHHGASRVFVGLPTTSACVVVVYLGFLSPPAVVVAVGFVVVAAMMVSRLAFPTGKSVLVLSLAGWVTGFAAIVGLVDMPVIAIPSILAIVVVVPIIGHLRARTVAEGAA